MSYQMSSELNTWARVADAMIEYTLARGKRLEEDERK